jgi:hypothetical protein
MRTNDKIYANDPIKKQRIQTLWHSYGIAVGRAAERSQQRYEVERMRFLIIYLHKLVEKN